MIGRWFAFAGLTAPVVFLFGMTAPAFAVQRAPEPAHFLARAAIIRVATAADFVKLTLPDGSEGRLKAELVVRFRRTLASEAQKGARTRIDWVQTMLVRETPEEVAGQLQGTLPTLGKLLMPDRSPLWFNTRWAEGPMPLPRDKIQGSVLSGMMLGNRIQFLANTPQEVYDEITAKGGTALPVPPAIEGLPPDDGSRNRSLNPPVEVWDADLAQ